MLALNEDQDKSRVAAVKILQAHRHLEERKRERKEEGER